MNQGAALVEFQHRRRGHAAIGFRRVVVGAREALVGQQARGSLQDVEVILSIDGETSDRADRPVFGQRLRKRGVVFEDRNLNFLRLTDEILLPRQDQDERDAERGVDDSLQMHARLPASRKCDTDASALIPGNC